jgi:hypothetical protein
MDTNRLILTLAEKLATCSEQLGRLAERDRQAMLAAQEFSLWIRVEKKLYGVEGIEGGGWRLTKLDDSYRPTDTRYTVTEGDYGYVCDCGDFIFVKEKRGEVCKHLRAAVESKLLLPLPGVESREPIRSEPNG